MRRMEVMVDMRDTCASFTQFHFHQQPISMRASRMKPSLHVWSRAVLCLGWAALLMPARGWAQSIMQPVVMRTGSGSVVLTATVPFTSSAEGASNPSLNLQFGFATEEQPQPGVFADSLSIWIAGPGGIAYLVTADASGPSWAPVSPGTLPVAEDAFRPRSAAFLLPSEGWSGAVAFHLEYFLPEG